METDKHFIQDAAELYAVFIMQQESENLGLAQESRSREVHTEFILYLENRGLSWKEFTEGKHSIYYNNVHKHLPNYVKDLAGRFKGQKFDFYDVEKAARNANLKADFEIHFDKGPKVAVSLKNYDLPSVGRIQVNSGTFNSFINNFFFEQSGVGMYLWPGDATQTFRGSSKTKRNAAYQALGLMDLIPFLEKLDNLNEEIKNTFVYGKEFEYLDEFKFDLARKSCGESGIALSLEILNYIDQNHPHLIKQRLLKMTGFAGSEELLVLAEKDKLDSITNSQFQKKLDLARSQASEVTYYQNGQGIRFDFISDTEVLFDVHIPFTINKNGAWISGEPYEGTRLHVKENKQLAYGQRRPKKSKELATSINTYLNLSGLNGSLSE